MLTQQLHINLFCQIYLHTCILSLDQQEELPTCLLLPADCTGWTEFSEATVIGDMAGDTAKHLDVVA